MASDAIRRPRTGPLHFMTKLSPFVDVYRPPTTAPSDRPSPGLIVILPWMYASPMSIAKYIRGYQALYPAAQILLVRSTAKHILWRPQTASADFNSAVSVIRSAVDSRKPGPQILLHIFSIGGSAALGHIRNAFGNNLPPHVSVFDSGPGLSGQSRSVAAITAEMRGAVYVLLYPVAHFFTFLYYVLYWRRRDAFEHFYLSHNSSHNELRRVYIYSESDQLMGFADVEKHAAMAKDKGYSVRMEKFHGTQHVSHVRANEDRYWAAIRETWEG
ncbi:unnamed protein product [Clonostachys rosea]|uniref:Indole-diterpene biosynthesis protein PaxU n=1 Tax=Bionectria ochroleuca TaxID=29856 RepID=A0ABY6UWM4_BIOOC|nr:unnamed protein product [Clonostachys rosea]